jgi:hypothetical protein
MRYTLTWDPAARRRLAELYNPASDKRTFSAAANRIERELCDDADKKRTPAGRFRVYSDDPLAVLFEVDPGDCMVRIHAVRRK